MTTEKEVMVLVGDDAGSYAPESLEKLGRPFRGQLQETEIYVRLAGSKNHPTKIKL